MKTWHAIIMKYIVEQTWVYRCCSWDLCSKRFHEFVVRKYMELKENE